MAWCRLVLLLGLLMSGCGETILTQWPKEAIFNQYFRLQDVKLGMSRQEVDSIMGPPSIREEGDFSRGRFTFYFYRTHNMDYDGSETVRGGYTPLVFQKDVLVGLGRRDYRRTVDRPYSADLENVPWK